MSDAITKLADAAVGLAVNAAGGAPGVVAMTTVRKSDFYEGVAGKRELGEGQPMTLDSVTATFSTAQAINGTCTMQPVEEGRASWTTTRSSVCPKSPSFRYTPASMPRACPQLEPRSATSPCRT